MDIRQFSDTLELLKKCYQKGNYINCYCGNKVVLIPQYNDPNDQIALNLIQSAYPGRKVVGIDAKAIIKRGGMIHCITQQQPINRNKVELTK